LSILKKKIPPTFPTSDILTAKESRRAGAAEYVANKK